MEYRFYVNNGKVKYFPGLERLSLIGLHSDSRDGRILQENIPLPYVPTAIITGEMTIAEMLDTKRRLQQKKHEVTVTRR